MGKLTRAMKSDTVLLLSLIYGFLLSIGGGISYYILMLPDIGGYILGKLFISSMTARLSSYPTIKTAVSIGSGFIVYTLTSYIWFTALYVIFKKPENRRKVASKLKRR